MATRDIRTHTPVTSCDVCGRTLLRGERSEVYLSGGDRKNVCELCKTRALHEGWLREGTMPEYAEAENGRESRGSLLRRLRSRREGERRASRRSGGLEISPPEPVSREAPPPMPVRAAATAPAGVRREPRHVRAVPTSAEQKAATAMELFNGSEHKRTIAGVARSLGAPAVSVRPLPDHPSLVSLVMSWELCWYRYEVDLGEELPHIRPAGQGYELSDLGSDELEPNALADERGSLSPAA